jgi:hypothetical protein
MGCAVDEGFGVVMKYSVFFLMVLGWLAFAAPVSAQTLFQNNNLTVEYYKRLDNGKIALERAWDVPEAERQKMYESLLRGKPRYDLKNGIPSKTQGGSFRLVFRDKTNRTRLIAYAYPGVSMLQEVTEYETLFYRDKKYFMMFLMKEIKARGFRKTPEQIAAEPPSWHCANPLVSVVYNMIEEKRIRKFKLSNPRIQICDQQTLRRYSEFLKDIPVTEEESLTPWSKPKSGSFLFFKNKPEVDFPEDVAVFPGYIQVSEAIWNEYAVQDTGGLYDILKKDTEVGSTVP